MAYLDENGLEHFWGKIKDRVSSAVAPKADDADVVHKTGDETLEGAKTFQNTGATPVAGNSVSTLTLRNPEVTRGVPLEDGNSYTNIVLADAEGDTQQTYEGRLAIIEHSSPKVDDPNGEYVFMGCYRYDEDSPRLNNAKLLAGYDTNGTAYSTAPATSDDRINPTDIVTRGYMEASEWNWQKTKKNVFVQFKPVPESDLEPVIDFMFTETLPASGDKSPSNPSTITGVTQAKVTRCGKNLERKISTATINGVTATSNGDGTYVLSNIATQDTYFTFTELTIPCKAGEKYNLSGISGGSSTTYRLTIQCYDKTGNYINGTFIYSGNTTFTPESDGFLTSSLFIKSGTAMNSVAVNPQIVIGDTESSFESPIYDDYTISLGDTYYGGSLDVATGVMTVTHTMYDIGNAMTNYSTSNEIFYFDALKVSLSSLPVCESFVYHAQTSTFTELPDGQFMPHVAANPATQTRWIFRASNYSTVDAFKTAFAGKKLVYQLATPFTVQLTPTQIRSLPALDKYEPRINTIYTDQEAVQVGYQRYVGEDSLVHRTGNETIDGIKTFYKPVISKSASGFKIKYPYLKKGTNPSSTVAMSLAFDDGEPDGLSYLVNRLGFVGCYVDTNGVSSINMVANKFEANAALDAVLSVHYNPNDNSKWGTAPLTLLSRNTSDDIVTRSYITISDVYVDPVNGSDSNEGTSASAAFKTIGVALSKTQHLPRCIINIAAGTYTENLAITNNRNYLFKLLGNVVLNGNFSLNRNSLVYVYSDISNVTFTTRYVTVQINSVLVTDVKYIIDNINNTTCLDINDQSVGIFGKGLEVVNNSGTTVSAIYIRLSSYCYITKELTIYAGSVANSAIYAALLVRYNSDMLIDSCTSNISCTSTVIEVANNSCIHLYNGSYSDTANIFNATTSGRTAISALSGMIRNDNVKMVITTTRDENNANHILVNLNDCSSFRIVNAQLSINCTGKAYILIGTFINSNFVIQSGTLALNGATYGATIRCFNNSICFIGSGVTVSGTVTGGQRFNVNRGGQIDIQGHSAGLNRIPGGSAGVVEASSYGYYG